MDFSYKPINLFQNNEISSEDKANKLCEEDKE